MRKSKSLLKNFSSPQGAHPGGYAPHYNSPETLAHANQIQQRLDQFDFPAHPVPHHAPYPAHDPYAAAYPQPPMPAYGHMPYPMPHQPMPVPQPSEPMMPQGSSEMGTVKANLDQLAAKINSLTQLQQNNSNSRTDYDQLKQQLQLIARAVGELQVGFSAFQQKSIQPDHIAGLKNTIDQSYRDILNRLDDAGNTSIDPNAYAQAVESSHADIIAQVKQIQSEMHAGTVSPENLIGAVESGYLDVSDKIEQLSQSLNQLEQPQASGELAVIRSQLDTLSESVTSLSGREIEVPVPDFSTVEMRLEEVNRAIVALSSLDQGTDNLERIEARLIDLSRELDSLKAPEPAMAPAEMEMGGLENHFLETNNALRDIESRLAGRETAPPPAMDEFSEELKRLGEKVDNISVFAANPDDSQPHNDGALLQRLDELVERVEQLRSPELDDNEGAENALLISLQEQVQGISDQLNGFAGSSPSLGPVTKSLDNLEMQVGTNLGNIQQQLETNFNSIEQQLGATRDISIELAAGAAEEAVRRVMHELPSGGNGAGSETIEALHQDLQKLHETLSLSTGNDVRFDQLEETMGAIADRIGALESSLANQASVSAQSTGIPVVESMAAGMADLNADHIPTEPAAQPVAYSEPVQEQTYAEQQMAEPSPAEHQPLEHQPAEQAFVAPEPAASMEEPAFTAVDPAQEMIQPNIGETPHETYAAEPFAEPQPVAEPVNPPAMDVPEFDNLQKSEPEMSAGERLVRAARMAESERQRAKQEYQDEFATRQVEPTYAELPVTHETSMPGGYAESLPDMQPPEMAPAEIPEAQMESPGMAPIMPEAGEDRPLEPGTDGPDLASLVRQANERSKTMTSRNEGASGTDFLAAARKAAQAAALEASVVESEGQPEKPEKSKSLLKSLPSLIGKKKKAVVIAAAAALLLAVAVPIISKFALNDGGSTLVAETIIEEVQPNTTTADAEDADTSLGRVTLAADFQEDGASAPIEQLQAETQAFPTEISVEQTASIPAVAIQNSLDLASVDFASDALRAAAEQNDPAAIFEIARRYTNGIGTEKNLEKAAVWYKQAANLGYVPAQYLIGNFNEKGIGIPKDRTMPEAWYEQAAENGHVVAMHNLAVMNASPDPATGNTNMDKAYKWFTKAAEHGVRDSQVNVGIFLAKGAGIPVDLVEAYKWFAVAAKSGDSDAAQKRDFIADAMRPDQLQTARKLVEDWKQIEPDQLANLVSVPDSWKSTEDKFAVLTDQNSIAQAQTLLTKIGFDVGPADGVMGQ